MQGGVHLDRQCGCGRTVVHPHVITAFGCHGQERQGVLGGVGSGGRRGATSRWLFELGGRLAVTKRPDTRCRLAPGKQAVDHIDHGLTGAVVGAQHVMPPFCGTSGIQVAVNVCTPKTVNGLFGVANEQQRARTAAFVTACCACIETSASHVVNLVKQPVLQGRSVLKLIHQRHRVLLPYVLAQPLATARAGQRGVQAGQHVLKPELPCALLEQGHALAHTCHRMGTHCGAHRGQGGQRGLQACKCLELSGQLQRCGPVGAGFGQAVWRQALPGGAGQRGQVRGVWPVAGSGPVRQRLDPFGRGAGRQQAALPVLFAGRRLVGQPVLHGPCLGQPGGAQLPQRRSALGLSVFPHAPQRLGGQCACGGVAAIGIGKLEQAVQVGGQCVQTLEGGAGAQGFKLLG